MAISRTGNSPIYANTRAPVLLSDARVAWVFSVVLVGTFMTTGFLQPYVRFHPAFFVSVVTVLAGIRMRGSSILDRTLLDYFFFGWIILAIGSQIYATGVLGRVMFAFDILQYFYVIFQCWAIYRAGYALVQISPTRSPRILFNVIIGFCALAALLGIAQDTPAGDLANRVAFNIGSLRDTTLQQEELTSPRPASIFSTPTMFGSFCTLGILLVLAIALGSGDRLRTRHIPTIFVLCGLFFAATFVAQVRIALLYQLLLILFFLFYTVYRSNRAVAVLVLLSLVGPGAFLSTRLGTERFTYLAQSFEGDLFADESFQFRIESWRRIGELAPELAPMGSGFTLLASNAFARRGDIYSQANGPDSGYFEAFFLHGIPGTLHLFFLFLGCFHLIRELGRSEKREYSEVRWALIMVLLLFFVAGSVLGVTHGKFERGALLYVLLGAGAGLVAVGERTRKYQLESGAPHA